MSISPISPRMPLTPTTTVDRSPAANTSQAPSAVKKRQQFLADARQALQQSGGVLATLVTGQIRSGQQGDLPSGNPRALPLASGQEPQVPSRVLRPDSSSFGDDNPTYQAVLATVLNRFGRP